jgi:hypothetical protein
MGTDASASLARMSTLKHSDSKRSLIDLDFIGGLGPSQTLRERALA